MGPGYEAKYVSTCQRAHNFWWEGASLGTRLQHRGSRIYIGMRATSSPGSLLPPESLGTRLRYAYAIDRCAALSTVHHVIKTIPRKDQAVKAFYLVRSSDQGPISTIKIFDPGRKRFHGRCVGDYPLQWWSSIGARTCGGPAEGWDGKY